MTTGTRRSRAWESRGNVIGNAAAQRRGALPSRLMATQAVRGSKRIVVVDVALRAGRRKMRSYQGKSRNAVIERRPIPARCGMAVRAIDGRKRRSGSRVRGIVRSLPSCQVALCVATCGRRNL